jgi:hypothetical protein
VKSDKLILNENGGTRLVKIHELEDAYSRKAFEAASIRTDASGMLVMMNPVLQDFRSRWV